MSLLLNNHNPAFLPLFSTQITPYFKNILNKLTPNRYERKKSISATMAQTYKAHRDDFILANDGFWEDTTGTTLHSDALNNAQNQHDMSNSISFVCPYHAFNLSFLQSSISGTKNKLVAMVKAYTEYTATKCKTHRAIPILILHTNSWQDRLPSILCHFIVTPKLRVLVF